MKRIDLVRIEVARARARRLREAHVEAAAGAARDMGEHAVEHAAVAFVLVEALVEKRPQHAAALRDAEGERAIERAGAHAELRRALVLEASDGVANRRQSQARQRRISRRVDDLVNAFRREAAGQVDTRGVRHDVAAAVEARELPVAARNRLPRTERLVADRQGMRVAREVGRVGDVVAVAERVIADAGARTTKSLRTSPVTPTAAGG